MYIYRGNIHIHTSYSDGTCGIEEIAYKASKHNLDFIIINDHRHLLGKYRGQEGFYHDVLVLIGSELNLTKNHYLAVGIDEETPRNEENPQAVIDDVNRQGGIGFIAHPYEKGTPLVRNGITYPWTDWEVEGYQGIELINYSSKWREGAQTLLQGAYANFINDQAFMEFPCMEALNKWMELTREKQVVGIAASDAHAPILSKFFFAVTILSYDYLFRAANNYLYLREELSQYFEEAKAQVLEALRRGNLYIAHDRKQIGQGLLTYIYNMGYKYLPGDILHPGVHTIVSQFKSPPGKRLKLKLKMFRDGELVREYPFPFRERIEFKPGTYHLVISHPKEAYWIVLNPFYVWN